MKPIVHNSETPSKHSASEKHKIATNEQNHVKTLAQIDGKEILCFVCKAPLKRIEPKGEGISELVTTQSSEILYECENRHVFSGDAIIYLYLNDEI